MKMHLLNIQAPGAQLGLLIYVLLHLVVVPGTSLAGSWAAQSSELPLASCWALGRLHAHILSAREPGMNLDCGQQYVHLRAPSISFEAPMFSS